MQHYARNMYRCFAIVCLAVLMLIAGMRYHDTQLYHGQLIEQLSQRTATQEKRIEQLISHLPSHLVQLPMPESATQTANVTKYVQDYKYALPVPATRPENGCGIGPEFRDFFELGVAHRSRQNEDKIVYQKLFKGKWEQFGSPGTYVEMGAFDGRTESNSRFFDVCLGWKGLLIEGNPESYAKVLKARPQAHKMSFAPSCSDEYERTNKTIEFYKYPMTNVGLVGHAKTYTGKPTVDVPCGPLTPVLQHVFGIERINFFSLDVEGAEPLALDTIDFNEVFIEVMMIEVENKHCRCHCEARDKVREKLKSAGYRRHEGVVRASDIYIHPKSRYQL